MSEANPISSQPGSGSKPSGGWQPPTLEAMQAMLPQYQFVSLLGRGGMGAVYKAVQVSLDRAVAIKVLPGDLIDDVDANFTERFKNEARTMARMNHPSIVNVYDFGETQTGLLYIVMEFIDGTDVSKMIVAQGKLPENYALSITAHVCDALNYAHTHGVIHRDIKPANILINMDGAVKVADFGLAKQSDAGMSGLTKTNMAMGTPDFVAPEALIPGIPLDGRADLYAIGVMLYQMLTGEIPRGMWMMPALKLGTDPRFDAIISKAMQTDREARYQSAVEIRRDLDTILTTPRAVTQQQPAASAAPKPVAHGPRPPQQKVSTSEMQVPPPPTKKSNLGMIIGLGSTALLLAGGYYLLQPSVPSKPASVVNTPASAPPKSVKAPTPTPSSKPAKAASTTPVTAPPLPPGVAKQTIDLLALTDPVLDRVPVPGLIGKNEWLREGGELVFQPDGKSGKLAAPVAFDCRDYEIEFKAKKHSGNDRIHVDVPLSNGRILPIILNGGSRKVLNEKDGMKWGPAGGDLHVTIRVIDGAGASDRIVIQRKQRTGEPLADWTGDLNTLAKVGEEHPAFSKQSVTSVYVVQDKYAVQTWTLRVFEGESKILRDSTVPVAASPVPSPAPAVNGAVNLLALVDVKRDAIEGNWSLNKGELRGNAGAFARLAFDYQPPAEYDFRVSFTRLSSMNAVSQHVVHGGHDVMWLMGGFGNSVLAFEMIGGQSGKDNATTVKTGIENGRRYDSVVKVRRDRLQVELDGKLVVDLPTTGSDLGVDDRWKFPDPKKLGVGSQGDTVFHRIELVPVVAPAPVAAMPVPTASVPSPAPPAPTDPVSLKLADLEAKFQAAFERDAGAAYTAQIATLNKGYTAALDRALVAASKAGQLEEAVVLREEKQRIADGKGLPPEDLDTLPESLKKLRATWRATEVGYAKLRNDKSAPLYDAYDKALDAYQIELTRQNKIDAALRVKAVRDDITRQKSQADAGAVTAPPGSAVRTGMKSPAVDGSEPSSAGGRGSRWYDAAHWVVSVGGSLKVEKNGKQSAVNSESEIPSGRFAVLSADINGNPKSQSIRDDDFTRLAGLKELNALRLDGLKITDAAFAFLATTPALDSLILNSVPVTDAVLVHLSQLKNLTELQIQRSRQFTGAGLEKLASLPLLRRVWFSGSGVTDDGARALAGGKSLEILRLDQTAVSDEGIAVFGSLPKLHTLALQGCKKVRGTSLARWGSMASLRTISLGGCPLGADIFPVIGRFTQLTDLELDYVSALTDETLVALAPLTKLTRFGASTCRITGTGFDALSGWTEMQSLSVGNTTTITGEGLAAIAVAFPQLDRLTLGGGATLSAADFRVLAGLKSLTQLEAPIPTLDDAAMTEIGHIGSLEYFYTVDSVITAQGVAALKSLKQLNKLRLLSCKKIDDTAIPALSDLKMLQELQLTGSVISDAGVAALKKALPQCRVTQ